MSETAFPTLAAVPDFPLSGEPEDNTLRSPVEGGYVQTRRRFTRSRRSFGVTYSDMSAEDMAALDAHYDAVECSDVFTWTRPLTSNSYTVRFKAPIKSAQKSNNRWSANFTLEEA